MTNEELQDKINGLKLDIQFLENKLNYQKGYTKILDAENKLLNEKLEEIEKLNEHYLKILKERCSDLFRKE